MGRNKRRRKVLSAAKAYRRAAVFFELKLAVMRAMFQAHLDAVIAQKAARAEDCFHQGGIVRLTPEQGEIIVPMRKVE